MRITAYAHRAAARVADGTRFPCAQIIWTRVYTTDALTDILTAVAAQFAEQPFKARPLTRAAAHATFLKSD